MKNTKRFIAVALMAIMMLGATFTAMAANESVYEPTEQEKLDWVAEYVYSSAKIAAGAGSIAKVTDKKVLTSAFDQTVAVEDSIFEKLRLETKNEKYIYISRTILFDVPGNYIWRGDCSVTGRRCF